MLLNLFPLPCALACRAKHLGGSCCLGIEVQVGGCDAHRGQVGSWEAFCLKSSCVQQHALAHASGAKGFVQAR